jgi:hypothetical protein
MTRPTKQAQCVCDLTKQYPEFSRRNLSYTTVLVSNVRPKVANAGLLEYHKPQIEIATGIHVAVIVQIHRFHGVLHSWSASVPQILVFSDDTYSTPPTLELPLSSVLVQ